MPLSDKHLMALSKEELVTLAIEEAAEIIHAACKIQRHGFAPTGPDGTEYDNGRDICVEGEQCGAVLRILGGKLGINYGELSIQRTLEANETWGKPDDDA